MYKYFIGGTMIISMYRGTKSLHIPWFFSFFYIMKIIPSNKSLFMYYERNDNIP